MRRTASLLRGEETDQCSLFRRDHEGLGRPCGPHESRHIQWDSALLHSASASHGSERTVMPHGERLTVGRGRGRHASVCIVRRMPRMQVYLPDDLYEQVKTRQLPASELLQEAVRAEVRRQDLLGETDAYLAGLLAEVGEPSPQERARAEAIARRIASQQASRAS